MRIGDLTIGAGAWLAPMAGITDLPFRLLCREMGCALSFTEMISAKGLLCCPPGVRSVEQLYETLPGERVAVQLFGHDPAAMAEAARRMAALGRFCAIDINMGCPAPKIVKPGDGAALMRDVPLAAKVIAAVRGAVRLPLTVKMRLGWDETSVSVLELARAAEAEGADAVIVHGRTRAQFYAGEADWDWIARVKAAVGIPVIGNGDVGDADTAVGRLRESGCDAVMVGRAALGDPWVFRRIAAGIGGAGDALDGGVSSAGEMERIGGEANPAGEMGRFGGEANPAGEMERFGGEANPAGEMERFGGEANPAENMERFGGEANPAENMERFGGDPSPAERVETALRHAGMMAVWKGEALAIREMRKHFSWYLRGFPGCVEARRRCNEATTLREAEEIMRAAVETMEAGMAGGKG